LTKIFIVEVHSQYCAIKNKTTTTAA